MTHDFRIKQTYKIFKRLRLEKSKECQLQPSIFHFGGIWNFYGRDEMRWLCGPVLELESLPL